MKLLAELQTGVRGEILLLHIPNGNRFVASNPHGVTCIDHGGHQLWKWDADVVGKYSIAIAVAPRFGLICASGQDLPITGLDIETGNVRRVFRGEREGFSSLGMAGEYILAKCFWKDTVMVLRLPDFECTAEIADALEHFQTHPDDRLVACNLQGDCFQPIAFVDVEKGNPCTDLFDQHLVERLAFNRAGTLLVVRGHYIDGPRTYGYTNVYSFPAMELINEMTWEQSVKAGGLAACCDAFGVFVPRDDGKAERIAPLTGERIHSHQLHDTAIQDVAVDHASGIVATGDSSGIVRLWHGPSHSPTETRRGLSQEFIQRSGHLAAGYLAVDGRLHKRPRA